MLTARFSFANDRREMQAFAGGKFTYHLSPSFLGTFQQKRPPEGGFFCFLDVH
jgi:hypothetical protein